MKGTELSIKIFQMTLILLTVVHLYNSSSEYYMSKREIVAFLFF